MPYISKSDYVLWRNCPKNAWLRLHKPELYHAAALTEFEQSLLDTGSETERAARNLFPGGLRIAGTSLEAHQNELRCLGSESSILFQAVFANESMLAAIDVLQYRNEANACSISEIKSSTEVKEEHVYDLAFQVLLLQQLGFQVKSASVIHLNPDYVCEDALDFHKLFVTVDLTARIDRLAANVTQEIREACTYLLREVEPAGSCSCIYKPRSKHCLTFAYSNPQVPEYSVHDISYIGSSTKTLRQLVDIGALAIEDVPSDIKFSPAQSAQIRIHRTGGTVFEKAAISKQLGELSFPLHFIDYETYAAPIPLFARYRPYDQIPLQYSVHIVGSPGETPIHRDFLHTGSSDPSVSFLTSLRKHVGSFGAIIVWNKGFEAHVNDDIARREPDARDYVIDLNDRLFDLMDIFAKRYFMSKELRGKTSIKSVLPILAPHLSYSSLTIRDGATASLIWSRLLSNEVSDHERGQLSAQLREYCALDSYGMYAIWDALIRLINN
jgi:hypothetical protein